MMFDKHLIPNAATASNLLFGMCSLISTFEGNFFWSGVFILLALVADGMDGRLARYFGVSSEFGKEMDSLCDLGSFGIAPAVLAYAFCLHSYGYFGIAVVIFFALCGMWRLARFNVNTNVVHGFFMGLAIPSGGCIVATTTMLFLELGIDPTSYGFVYPISMIVVAYLMVSHVHYPDFKGSGEKIYLLSKIFAVIMFISLVGACYYVGGTAVIWKACLAAGFSTYAIFGIVNSLCHVMKDVNND